MIAVEPCKPLLILSLAILCTGLSWLVAHQYTDYRKTFSQYAATKKSLSIYYAILFIVALIPLLLFFIFWFVPMFNISIWFIYLLTVSCVTQVVCTFIPEVTPTKTVWHRIFAGASALTLFPALTLVLTANQLPAYSYLAIFSGLILMIGTMVATCVKYLRNRYALLLQIMYFVGFFVPILFTTYS